MPTLPTDHPPASPPLARASASAHAPGEHAPAPLAHYENFPVASWLCPPALRPPIAAIYHFARTADDLADEGTAPAAERLAALSDYGADLRAITAGMAPSPRWAGIFGPLAGQMRAFTLPVQPLADLLSAFEQDVRKTAAGAAYADWAELERYCQRSAAPVGRLLLHLYGVHDAESIAQSDAICRALQLINFWQDLSVDIPRGRYYLPLAECAAHGIAIDQPARRFAALAPDAATHQLIAACASVARAAMRKGTPLVHRVAGRAGWELRAVVQGALAVLAKVETLGAHVLHTRPRLGRGDAPRVLWAMLRM